MSLFSLFKGRGGDSELHLGPDEFVREYGGRGVVIDVRTPVEFATGHLANARNVDVMSPSFVTQVKELDMGERYFVYCRSGNRSQRAAQIMHDQGFEVFNIGGVGELAAAGAQIEE